MGLGAVGFGFLWFFRALRRAKPNMVYKPTASLNHPEPVPSACVVFLAGKASATRRNTEKERKIKRDIGLLVKSELRALCVCVRACVPQFRTDRVT